jgi:3-oxoacyl-[acyl-carrier protein] reductase
VKNILLTGVSRGIGAEAAKTLRAQGHKVVGVSRGLTGHPDDIQFDLEGVTAKHIEGLYQKARAKLAEPAEFQVLINNAGVCERVSVEHMDLAAWLALCETTIRINVLAALGLMHIFVRRSLYRLVETRVINICSRVAFKAQADAPHYALSKAALLSASRSLAARYASKNIGFFTLSPGWVNTEMASDDPVAMVQGIPAGRIATVHDVVKYISFYVNEEGIMYSTGNNVDINGASYFH